MDYPDINGNRFEFASVELRADGSLYIGIKSIDYTQAMDPGEVFGTSRVKIAETDGELKPEASFEMYKEEFNAMIAAFGDGYMLKRFTVVVNYSQNGRFSTDTLVGCRIKKHQDSHSQGTDALTVKVDLSLFGILYNGKAPVKPDGANPFGVAP